MSDLEYITSNEHVYDFLNFSKYLFDHLKTHYAKNTTNKSLFYTKYISDNELIILSNNKKYNISIDLRILFDKDNKETYIIVKNEKTRLSHSNYLAAITLIFETHKKK